MTVDMSDLSGFAEDTTVRLGDTEFTIKKMPAALARRIWREILHAIGGLDSMARVLGSEAAGLSETHMKLMLLQSVLALDVDFLEGIQKRMFAHVSYTNQMARTPQAVTGAEEMSLDLLDVIEVDELFIRAFAVNFIPSLLKLGTRVAALAPPEVPSNPSE